MIKAYSLKISLKENKRATKFLEDTEWNEERRKEKLIHIRGYLGPDGKKSIIRFACGIIRDNENISEKDLIIAYNGRWWDLYLIRRNKR